MQNLLKDFFKLYIDMHFSLKINTIDKRHQLPKLYKDLLKLQFMQIN